MVQFHIKKNKMADVLLTWKQRVRALRQVVEKQEDPDSVYTRLNLGGDVFSKKEWKIFLARYSDSEKIDALAAEIPETKEAMEKKLAARLVPMLEHWLLEQYILTDFDAHYEKMKTLPAPQKIFDWWKTRIPGYQTELFGKNVEEILEILARSSQIQEKEKLQWETFFKDRLQSFQKSVKNPLPSSPAN